MKSPYIQIQLIPVGVERSNGTPTGTSRLNRYQKHTDVIIMDFAKALGTTPGAIDFVQIRILWDKRIYSQVDQLVAL